MVNQITFTRPNSYFNCFVVNGAEDPSVPMAAANPADTLTDPRDIPAVYHDIQTPSSAPGDCDRNDLTGNEPQHGQPSLYNPLKRVATAPSPSLSVRTHLPPREDPR